MSEFEKWFWTDFDPDDGNYSIEIYIKVKQGWIAALEMVRDWASGRRFNEEDLLIMLYKELKANEQP